MSKEINSQLSDEFKKDIRENGGKNNILGTLLALLAIVLVFGTIGVAGYELVFKPEKVQQKSANEKIESRPTEVAETPKTETVTPAPVSTPTAPAVTPTATAKEYTVVEGDVLGSIATKFDTTVAKLMALNGITDENSLQIGQVIKTQ